MSCYDNAFDGGAPYSIAEMGRGLRIYKDTDRVTALAPDWKTTSCYARHVLIQTT